MKPMFTSVGPLVAASATNIRTASVGLAGALVLNGTLVSGGVATLDTPRRVLITTTSNTDSGKTIILAGTNWSNQTIGETITLGNAGTFQSVLDYKTLTSATLSADSVGSISIGTNGVASSPWVRFDHWIEGRVSIQCNVTGTANYTVQQTLDDPGQPVASPVTPATMQWLSSSDTAVVGATANQQSNYAYAPAYARILLNSGTGSVAGTFIQNNGL